jgi:magnesium-transporting ATPase (P-type)
MCVVILFLLTLYRDGWTPALGVDGDWMHAVTVAFAGLVIIQMVNTFSAIAPNESVFKTNYFRNLYHLGAVTISILFVLCIVYIPFLQEVLKTAPLTLNDWGLIITMSIIPMIIMEIRKFGRKRLAMSRINYEVPSLNY